MENRKKHRFLCLLLSILITISCLPVSASAGGPVGSGGGSHGSTGSSSFLAWGNIANQHSGVRVSIVDSDGKNKLLDPTQKAKRASVDICPKGTLEKLDSAGAVWQFNNKFEDNADNLIQISTEKALEWMVDAIRRNGYGREGAEKDSFANDLTKDGNNAFPTSVKTVNGIFQGNGKAIRAFFVLGQANIGAFEKAKQVQFNLEDLKLGGNSVFKIDEDEFIRQLNEYAIEVCIYFSLSEKEG